MLLISGYIDVDPSNRDEVVSASLAFAKISLDEPGCIEYHFTIDPMEAGRVHVLERWETDEALQAHMGSARSGKFGKWMNGMAKSVHVNRFEVVDDQSNAFRRASHELMGDSVEQ